MTEQEAVALAFANKLSKRGRVSWTDGSYMYLHGKDIIARFTFEGKRYVRFNMRAWPTVLTIGRMNAVARLMFGGDLFYRKHGQVFFGRTLLREVSATEDIILPEDFKIGDKRERITTISGTSDAHHREAPDGQGRRRLDAAGCLA